jgi:hypothetical protein
MNSSRKILKKCSLLKKASVLMPRINWAEINYLDLEINWIIGI